MSEQMAYKMQPAGHEKPEEKRKYEKPSNKLASAFEEWVKEYPDDSMSIPVTPDDRETFFDKSYSKAQNLTEKLNASVAEAHALAILYRDHPKCFYAGLFISAIYNKSQEKDIIFDLHECRIDLLAYKLVKGKRLINYEKLEGDTGFKSESPIINYGTMLEVGADSSSLIMNLGHADLLGGYGGNYRPEPTPVIINFGTCSTITGTCGIVLSLKKPRSQVQYNDTPYKPNILLKPKDCKKIPELSHYLKQMQRKFELGRKDYTKALAALDELGPEPGEKIAKDIEEILRGYKYDV